jgi:hypothetical protein
MGAFAVAVLLGLARLQRFEQPVLELVKGALLGCYRDQRQRRQRNWTPGLAELDPLDVAHSCAPPATPPQIGPLRLRPTPPAQPPRAPDLPRVSAA